MTFNLKENSDVKFIHSFISDMHHYECIAPNININLQSGRFWATLIALFRERFSGSRSCWGSLHPHSMGHPGGFLQFCKGEVVKICLASDSSGIRAMWPNRERRRAWTVNERCGCSVFRLNAYVIWCGHNTRSWSCDLESGNQTWGVDLQSHRVLIIFKSSFWINYS